MRPKPGEFFRAARLLEMGEPFLAERTATTALRLHPGQGDLLQVRGIARHQLGKLIDAHDDLHSAMTTTTLNPIAVWTLAEVSLALDKGDSARDLFLWLADREDTPTALLPRLVERLARHHEDELALDVAHRWSEHLPDLGSPHWAKALLMARLGYPARAVLLQLEAAVQKSPGQLSYKAQLAAAQAATGHAKEARVILADLPIAAIRCPHLATRVARACDQTGSYSLAQTWWDHAIQIARQS